MKAIDRKKSKSARRRDKRMKQKRQPTVNIVDISTITNAQLSPHFETLPEKQHLSDQPVIKTDFKLKEEKPGNTNPLNRLIGCGTYFTFFFVFSEKIYQKTIQVQCLLCYIFKSKNGRATFDEKSFDNISNSI
jgi:hypothetical protein